MARGFREMTLRFNGVDMQLHSMRQRIATLEDQMLNMERYVTDNKAETRKFKKPVSIDQLFS